MLKKHFHLIFLTLKDPETASALQVYAEALAHPRTGIPSQVCMLPAITDINLKSFFSKGVNVRDNNIHWDCCCSVVHEKHGRSVINAKCTGASHIYDVYILIFIYIYIYIYTHHTCIHTCIHNYILIFNFLIFIFFVCIYIYKH